MTAALEVKVVGFDKVYGKVTDPKIITRPLEKLLTDLGLLAQRVARQQAPRDTATLQRSIGLEVKPLYATVATHLVYASVMEFGRRPGARMPPLKALEGWARRHGFDKDSIFVLARAIARRGIKGRFFMKKAAIAVEKDMPSRVNAMIRAIEREWSK